MRIKASFVAIFTKEPFERFASIEQAGHTRGDRTYLTDGESRLRTEGIDPSLFVTGLIIGVSGVRQSPEVFVAQKYFLPPLEEIVRPVPDCELSIAIISELLLNSYRFDLRAGNQLVDFLNARSDISLLVIIGSTFAEPEPCSNANSEWTLRLKITEVSPVQMMGNFLQGIQCRKLLIPGSFDPVDTAWPQPPISPALLDGIDNIESTSNPASFQIGELSFLCASGDSVQDIVRETGFGFHDAQRQLLQWRLIAPTATATLPYSACAHGELLVFESLPHVFVCGGSPEFACSELSGISVISVPGFADARVAVVYDVRSGEVSTETFAEG
jgi:DNA polymerase II small subunit/DNA polymerase delta subunit B